MVENAKILSETLVNRGINVISGGTDNHIVLIDLRKNNISGKNCVEALERSGITCNKNGVPFDNSPPTITSGIRLGSSAPTTRGFGTREFRELGNLISDIILGFKDQDSNKTIEHNVKNRVTQLCKKFPIY